VNITDNWLHAGHLKTKADKGDKKSEKGVEKVRG